MYVRCGNINISAVEIQIYKKIYAVKIQIYMSESDIVRCGKMLLDSDWQPSPPGSTSFLKGFHKGCWNLLLCLLEVKIPPLFVFCVLDLRSTYKKYLLKSFYELLPNRRFIVFSFANFLIKEIKKQKIYFKSSKRFPGRFRLWEEKLWSWAALTFIS